MSVTNESSRIRSWFQFNSNKSSNNSSNNCGNNTSNSSNFRSDDENSKETECESSQAQQQSSNSLLERVTSFRRSLGKAQNRKSKIRPTSVSVKGLTSAVELNIAKSKSTSTTRKSSSPTTTSAGSAPSVSCDDDEIYGFTSANFDTSNANSRRQLKSSLHAPNTSVYESEANKSGRVRNEDESHPKPNTTHIHKTHITNTCKGVSKDSPEWQKAEAEFSFYHQQNQHNLDSRDSIQSRLYYYQHQYFQDSDINIRHSSTQHLSWTEPLNSEPDDIDRIYENMRGITTVANPQQRQHNHRNTSSANNSNVSTNKNCVNSNMNASETVNNNRKLTKDSGYESATTSISNWAAMNPNANALSNHYFHSRSDSNASSVSTGGSLSPRTAGCSAKSAYHYSDPWSSAKSTSNLPLQVHVSSSNDSGIRRSSLSGSSNAYSEGVIPNTCIQSVLPAKSVPGNLDKDSDESVLKKRSHNRNNPTPSSVYSLLASKSGFDFAPVLKTSRKPCFNENQIVAKYSDRINNINNKGSDINSSQLWKTHESNAIQTCGQEDQYLVTDDSPPPTPPVRDSSLASNRKFNLETQQNDAQNRYKSESVIKSNELAKQDRILGQNSNLYYKNNNSNYYMKSYSSENRVSHIGYSKSLVNLRSKYDESSDLKQFSQTYPLLPETEFNDKQMQESWSCDQSVRSGVTSLVTSSDYFTASSSVMTHSPSLSSLNTNATNTTSASYNNSRNSLSSTSSSSQIARSAKVLQPKRQETASVLFYDKPTILSDSVQRDNEVPPPPPPKLIFADYQDFDSNSKNSSDFVNKTIITQTSDSSKPLKTTDTDIKDIQKRAVYQFYLKQKQKEKQENSSTNVSQTIQCQPSVTHQSHTSDKRSSPITAANTFVDDKDVSLTRSISSEELLADKSELISRLTRKLDVLRAEESSLIQDIETNETSGTQMKNKLKSLGITAQESEKINLHCDETEKVTRLLLSISARLQQIEQQINQTFNQKCKIDGKELTNIIKSDLLEQSSQQSISQNDLQQMKQSFSTNNLFDEIQILVIKREKLLIQLEDALQLRVSIDNRSLSIQEKILKKYFKDSKEDLNEFIEFIKLKSKLIVEIREVRDKIQLGEKHLCALKTS